MQDTDEGQETTKEDKSQKSETPKKSKKGIKYLSIYIGFEDLRHPDNQNHGYGGKT